MEYLSLNYIKTKVSKLLIHYSLNERIFELKKIAVILTTLACYIKQIHFLNVIIKDLYEIFSKFIVIQLN